MLFQFPGVVNGKAVAFYSTGVCRKKDFIVLKKIFFREGGGYLFIYIAQALIDIPLRTFLSYGHCSLCNSILLMYNKNGIFKDLFYYKVTQL